MQSLKAELEGIKANFAKIAPDAAKQTMHASTEALRASGIMNGIPKVGDALPPFALADTGGNQIESTALLANGPLVVSFYRGLW
ncbi:MAG: hypothetical protein AAFZ65_09755 [Planctomycetota bacterium]